ncbi:phage head-tail adapter protein [Lactiplantibacillus plantarum]|nr:phage head-tail adapter protein [Lactiplantibacillus plantarum]
MELDAQMQSWLHDVGDLIPNTSVKSAMTVAEAQAYTKVLRKNTPRSNNDDSEYGHLQDNIAIQNRDIDGIVNGNTLAGFKKKAYVARFLNDGTVKMAATHFVDNSRKESQEAAFKAGMAVYKANTGGE